MSLWRQLTRGVRVLANRSAVDRELADEAQHFLDETATSLEATGLTPEQARREAQVQLGYAAGIREQVRDYGWENLVSAVAGDLRYALRQLRGNPGFALTAIFILALGIGATTAIFSVVNPILFKSLPYPKPGRLAMIWEKRSDGSPGFTTFGNFYGLASRTRSFEALTAVDPWQPTMTTTGEPERLEGQRVTGDYFRALGVAPALGRDFEAGDDRYRGPRVAILSNSLWRRRFAGDPAIIGQEVKLDDDAYLVVGVMPDRFENMIAPDVKVWSPLRANTALEPGSREWGHHMRMAGRLRPGVTLEQAANELNGIMPELGRIHAAGYQSTGGVPSMTVNAMQSDIARDVRPAVLAIAGAVVLVLLIACVNVTNLLLARFAQRGGEFAVRVAVGARQGHLVRQLLVESLLLAVAGGTLGIMVAQAGVRALLSLSPPDLPRLNEISLDGSVLAFALAVTALVGVAIGLIPAFQATRRDPQSALHQSTRVTGRGRQRTRRALVITEVALALVLLISAGLLLRSLQRIFSIDPGFDPSNMITMEVEESGHRYDQDVDRDRFFVQALEAVRHLPGVTAAAFTSQLPLSGDSQNFGMEFQERPNQEEAAFRYGVAPGYFEAMRIPLRRGRFLNQGDRAGAPVAVLMNESFARRKYGAEDPIGKRVRMGPDMGRPDKPWATVVGVVGDVKQLALGIDQQDAFYTTTTQWDWVDSRQSLVVRTSGDAAALAPAIRRTIWSIDKDQPIVHVATMETLVAASESQRRFALVLFEAFALVGLLLAATGIFGVLSGSVNERRREIGVRTALGASRSEILTLVLNQGMLLAGIGIAIGLAGSAAASRALTTLLFGITNHDTVTYLGVVSLLAGVSAVACWLPAWRATQVDPAITLRAE